jgi:hypothetical protein
VLVPRRVALASDGRARRGSVALSLRFSFRLPISVALSVCVYITCFRSRVGLDVPFRVCFGFPVRVRFGEQYRRQQLAPQARTS